MVATSAKLSSKFVITYERLFQGHGPSQINPNVNENRFWDDLFGLSLDRAYFSQKLSNLRPEECTGYAKPILHTIFLQSINHALKGNDDARMAALDTLQIIIRTVLTKNFAGWEIMEIFSGNLKESNVTFSRFAECLDIIIGDEALSPEIRHKSVQVAITFMASMGQLSPGAYLLRHNLFLSISKFILSPTTARFGFEGILLLGILVNFHRSPTNPYMKRLHETHDVQLLRESMKSCEFAANMVVKAYQNTLDDSPPTVLSSISSLVSSFRPDRMLASAAVDAPRELFKSHPIEAAVILLPLFELICENPASVAIFVESLDSTKAPASSGSPLLSLLSLASYILAHASSSPRAAAYGKLMLANLLVLSEDPNLMAVMCNHSVVGVRLCRQRMPALPVVQTPQPPVCALFDCCVLWLRHNLHKKLDVSSYIICLRIASRVIWFLQRQRIRLAYHWSEFWRALLGALDFLTGKKDVLASAASVDELIQELLSILQLALNTAEVFLPGPPSIHEFIYELARAAPTLRQQSFKSTILHSDRHTSSSLSTEDPDTEARTQLVRVAEFYEEVLLKAGARTPGSSMRAVARDIERDGVHGTLTSMKEPPNYSEGLNPAFFARWMCSDALALMP